MLRNIRLLGLLVMFLTATTFAQSSNILDDANNFSTDLVDGQLIPLNPFTVYSGVNPTYIAIDPNGNHLYAANLNSNTISMYSINKDTGILTPLVPATTAYTTPSNITINPKGTYLYAVSFSSANISVYKINPNTGLLSLISTAKGKKSSTYLTVDPNGQFLYTLNADTTISGYQIDQKTGNLKHKFDKATSLNNNISINCDALGRYLYATNNSGISVYKINSKDGSLATANPISTQGATFGVVTDPSGQNLYATNVVLNPSSMYISMFSVSGGNIVPLNPDSVLLSNSGYFSYGIAIDPAGKYVYATFTNNYIAMFNRDRNTGLLTPINQSIETKAYPFGIVVDPSGNFVYVTNYTDGTISMYRINHSI